MANAPERLSASELVTRLSSQVPRPGSVLLFDADGTLWSGDVAEDSFYAALGQGAIRDEAREPLEKAARAHGVSVGTTPSETARRIYDAYLTGGFPELTVCEVMIWCFAGWTPDELRALAVAARSSTGHEARRTLALQPVITWAKQTGMRTLVVSASPRWALSVALESWGILETDLVASTSVFQEGRATLELEMPIPYGPTKAVLARKKTGDAPWLAAFGDSLFDFEMMREAKIAVGVAPKPDLVTRLEALNGALVLETTLEEPHGPR